MAKNGSRLRTGIVIGIALGAAAALLLAPKTGAEARQAIRRKFNALPEEYKEIGAVGVSAFMDARDRAKSYFDVTKQQVQAALALGKEETKRKQLELEREYAERMRAAAAGLVGTPGIQLPKTPNGNPNTTG